MPRYVDLDKLAFMSIDVVTVNHTAYVDIREVQQALRQAEAETGEVEPVVHAKWIPIADGAGAECENCGEYYDSTGACDLMKGFRLFAKFYRHCPNCGAKMDKEVNNNAL